MGTVIKATQARALGGLADYNMDSIEQTMAGLVTKAREQVDEARTQREEMIDAAQARCQEMIDQARTQAEGVRQEASQAGRAEGRAQGEEEGVRLARDKAAVVLAEQTAQLTAALAELLRQMESQRLALHKQAVDGCLRLAVRVAERILHREVRVDPTVVEATLGEALELACANGQVTVAVAPQDLQTAERLLPELLAGVDGAAGFRVTPSESVGPGGCRIATDRGEVDARLAQQLDNIERQLLGDPGD
jgi:flagellar assembly protein FliH